MKGSLSLQRKHSPFSLLQCKDGWTDRSSLALLYAPRCSTPPLTSLDSDLTDKWRIPGHNILLGPVPPSLHPRQQDPTGSAFLSHWKVPLTREERAEFLSCVDRTESENTVVYTGQTLDDPKFVQLTKAYGSMPISVSLRSALVLK